MNQTFQTNQNSDSEESGSGSEVTQSYLYFISVNWQI